MLNSWSPLGSPEGEGEAHELVAPTGATLGTVKAFVSGGPAWGFAKGVSLGKFSNIASAMAGVEEYVKQQGDGASATDTGRRARLQEGMAE